MSSSYLSESESDFDSDSTSSLSGYSSEYSSDSDSESETDSELQTEFQKCDATLTRDEIKKCRRDATTLIGCRLTQCDSIRIGSWLTMRESKDVQSLTRVFQLALGMGHVFSLIYIHCRKEFWASLKNTETSRKILYHLRTCHVFRDENDQTRRECDFDIDEILRGIDDRNQDNIDRIDAIFEKLPRRRKVKIALDVFNANNAMMTDFQSPWYKILADTVVKDEELGMFMDEVVNTSSNKTYNNLIEVLHDGIGERMAGFSDTIIYGLTKEQVDSAIDGIINRKLESGHRDRKEKGNEDDAQAKGRASSVAHHRDDEVYSKEQAKKLAKDADLLLGRSDEDWDKIWYAYKNPKSESINGEKLQTIIEDLQEERAGTYNDEYITLQDLRELTTQNQNRDGYSEFLNKLKRHVKVNPSDQKAAESLIKGMSCMPGDVIPDVVYMNDTTQREDVFCPLGYQRRRYNGDFGGCCKKAVKKWQNVRQTFLTATRSPEQYRQSMKRQQAMYANQYKRVMKEIDQQDEYQTPRGKQAAKDERVINSDDDDDDDALKRLRQQSKKKHLELEASVIEQNFIDDDVIRGMYDNMRKQTELYKEMKVEMQNAMQHRGGDRNIMNITDLYEDVLATAFRNAMQSLKLKLKSLVRYEGAEYDSWFKTTVLSSASFAADLIIETVMNTCDNMRVANLVLAVILEWRNQMCADISIKLGYEKRVSLASKEGVEHVAKSTTDTLQWGYEMLHAITGPGLADSMKDGMEMLIDVSGAAAGLVPAIGPVGAKVASAAGKFGMKACHQHLKLQLIQRMYRQGLGTAMEIFTAPCIQTQTRLCGMTENCEGIEKGGV